MARILIVDDDKDMLKVARMILANANHTVLVADNTLDAMNTLQTQKLDAVITDLNMPDHSGFELVQNIRQSKYNNGIAIAMFTGRRQKDDVEKAIGLGVDAYIVKPLDPVEFVKKVDRLFARKPAERVTEVALATTNIAGAAKLTHSVRIASISELGMVIRTPHKLDEGMNVDLDAEIFQDMGVIPPPMKIVSSVRMLNSPKFESRVIFCGSTEDQLQKMRDWLGKQATRSRSSA